jgi:tetratricopeptide (TPR) repeat protein
MISTVLNPIEETATVLNGVPAAEIRAALDLILRSRAFIQSHRIRRFLQFVVEESLLGQPHRLKEYLIGLEVFDRREAFDPRVDSIVRVEARRLRYKLDEYYRVEGREDAVRIVLRKGSYVPIFEYRHTGSGASLIAPRRCIEISQFSLMNATSDTGSAAEEVQRRLTHVLIKEGCFQVVAQFQPNAPTAETVPAGHPPDYVLEGSIEFHAEGFRLLLQLLQSADRSYIWSETVDCRLEDLACVDHLAQQLVRDLAAPAGVAVIARRQPDRTESGDAYLQGRYHWKLATPDSIRNSIAFFSQAVEADPNYGAAWAALSEALLVSSVFGLLSPMETHARMKEAAILATSLNPSLPEARVALGGVLSLLDWEWAAGEEEMQKSIQLDKSDPVGHVAYGIQLACRGEGEAAIAEVERALELDPASLFPNFVLGWLYGVCRRFDEAIGQHVLVSRLAPDYGLPHLGLGMACAGKGLFADAIAHLTNATQMKCGSLLHSQMGYCYARLGRSEEALREIGILNTRSESSYVSPMSFAAIYSGLGEWDETLRYLDRALEIRDTSLHLRLLSTEFDNLRDHPRFLELRSQIGLRQAGYAHSA